MFFVKCVTTTHQPVEVERNHKMALHGLPWISAKPHSISVISDTIKLNPACQKVERSEGSGEKKKRKCPSTVKQNDKRRRCWRSVWQVQGLIRELLRCALFHLPAWTWWEGDWDFKMCVCAIICRSLCWPHYWWSLIPRLEKGGCPTKRSDVT